MNLYSWSFCSSLSKHFPLPEIPQPSDSPQLVIVKDLCLLLMLISYHNHLFQVSRFFVFKHLFQTCSLQNPVSFRATG